MSTKFTPGKWHTDKNSHYMVYSAAPDRKDVRELVCQTYGHDSSNNAKLIAAAPDLLDTLLKLLDCVELSQESLEHETIDLISHALELVGQFT